MKTLIRWSLALLLLPLLWAVFRENVRMVPAVWDEGLTSWWRYALGASGYLIFEQFLRKPMWLYVVGHELTHAISGLLCGAQVHSFKAKSTGGEVRLSKSNAFIALSPYVVPFYLVVLIGLYALLHLYWPNPKITWVFQFLIGAALAFHLSMTWAAFHSHQSDLKVLGFFLSGVLILIGNGLLIGVLTVALFTKTPPLKVFAWNITKETTRLWWNGAREGIQLAKNHLLDEKTAWTR